MDESAYLGPFDLDALPCIFRCGGRTNLVHRLHRFLLPGLVLTWGALQNVGDQRVAAVVGTEEERKEEMGGAGDSAAQDASVEEEWAEDDGLCIVSICCLFLVDRCSSAISRLMMVSPPCSCSGAVATIDIVLKQNSRSPLLPAPPLSPLPLLLSSLQWPPGAHRSNTHHHQGLLR